MISDPMGYDHLGRPKLLILSKEETISRDRYYTKKTLQEIWKSLQSGLIPVYHGNFFGTYPQDTKKIGKAIKGFVRNGNVYAIFEFDKSLPESEYVISYPDLEYNIVGNGTLRKTKSSIREVINYQLQYIEASYKNLNNIDIIL